MSPSAHPSVSEMSQTADVQSPSSIAVPSASASHSAEPTVPGDASSTQLVAS